jgi:short-subunit dehydrogenase
MIDLNITSVHILTKKFLEYFENKGTGKILNVASSAGLMPGGPLMSAYYATKAYVVSLTRGIYEELRRQKSAVKISVLCPGPVDTEFNSVAGVDFSLKGLDSYKIAEYAIKKLLKGKTVIIPGFSIKFAYFLNRLVPSKIALRIAYKIQKKKNG